MEMTQRATIQAVTMRHSVTEVAPDRPLLSPSTPAATQVEE